jgi:hypothetical protein
MTPKTFFAREGGAMIAIHLLDRLEGVKRAGPAGLEHARWIKEGLKGFQILSATPSGRHGTPAPPGSNHATAGGTTVVLHANARKLGVVGFEICEERRVGSSPMR